MRVSSMQPLKKARSYGACHASLADHMPLHASCAKNEWRAVNRDRCAVCRDQLQRDVLNARGFEVARLNGRVVQQDLSAGRPSDKEHGA